MNKALLETALDHYKTKCSNLESQVKQLRADLDVVTALWNCGIREKATMNEIRARHRLDVKEQE